MAHYAMLKQRVKAAQTATQAMHEAIRGEFPEGAAVAWMHGRHRQSGFVTRHGYGGNLWAENHVTGCEVRITIHQILDALHD